MADSDHPRPGDAMPPGGPAHAPAQDAAPDWPAIRAAYQHGPLRVDQICAEHGVTRRQLYTKIERDGWLTRRLIGRETRPRLRRGKATNAALVAKLYRRFERHMDMLDARIRAAGLNPVAPGDDEREARTLAVLARTLEKLIEIEGGIAARRQESDGATEQYGRDAERLVAELSRRLRAMAASDPGPAGRVDPGAAAAS